MASKSRPKFRRNLEAAERDKIFLAFPKGITRQPILEFIRAAVRAVQSYDAFLPIGKPTTRAHRSTAKQSHPRSRHRPPNGPRQILVSDLFDAYMETRGDNLEARGFKQVADAVLTIYGLDEITDHDLTTIRSQRRPFVDYVESNWPEAKRNK